jgi:hypothetical protein
MPMVADVANGPGMRGLVRTIAPGTTAITAELEGVTGSATLTVTAAVVTQLQVTPANPTLPREVSQPFQAVAVYDDFSTQNVTALVTWTSTDAAVAPVSNAAGSHGLVTTLAASFMNASGSSVVTVTAATLTAIVITPAMPSLAKGNTQQLTAAGRYSDGTTLPLTDLVTWTSSAQTTVGAVSNVAGSRGLVTAVGTGTATIEAHFQGQTGTVSLTVTP